MKNYNIKAKWDAKASVYVAACDEIGLVTEAPNFEALMERLSSMVPEMVGLNDPQDRSDIRFHVVAKRNVKVSHPH
jgi:hypothetical protein